MLQSLPPYSVEVVNVGKTVICVNDFMMGTIKNSRVGFGDIYPNTEKGMSSVMGIPHEKQVITWQNRKTGYTRQVEVSLKLPKGFANQEYHSTIKFYLNPDTNTMTVTYNIFDDKLHDFVEVDSDGNRIPQKLPY